MCGLMGIIGPNLKPKHTSVYLTLMLASYNRGQDAAGSLAVYNKGESFSIIHQASDCVDFITDHLTKPKNPERQHFWHDNMCSFMGHVRQATKGKKDDIENAHPFEFEHVTGAHNGTIHGVFPNSTKFDVDSEAIFYNLNENKGDIRKTIAEMDTVYSCAYALTWFNHTDQTFHFLRNDKRSLWIGECKDFIIYASEPGPIHLVKKWYGLYPIKVYSLEKDTHIWYDLTKEDFISHKHKEEIKHTCKTTVHHHNTHTHVHHTNVKHTPINGYPINKNHKAKLWPLSLQKEPLITPATNRPHILNPIVPIHEREYISIGPTKTLCFKRHLVMKILNSGCNNCSNPVDITEVLDVRWLTNEEFACKGCKDLDIVKSIAKV